MNKFFLYLSLLSSVLLPQELPKVNEIFKSFVLKNVYLNGFDNDSPKLVHITVSAGVIENISANLPNDNASFIYDGDSAYIYPAFLDAGMLLKFSAQKDSAKFAPGNPPNWAAGVQPELEATDFYKENMKSFSKFLKLGFLKANMFLDGGLLSGSNLIANLEKTNHLVKSSEGLFFRFKSARGSYPSSIIGMMAKFRQLFLDAEDYKRRKEASGKTNNNAPFVPVDQVMEELVDVLDGKQIVFFEANSESEILRVLKLKNEFKFRVTLVGCREIGRVADAVKAANVPVIYSLNLPSKIPNLEGDSTKTAGLVSLYLSKESDEKIKKRYDQSLNEIWSAAKTMKEKNIPFAFATMDVQTDSIRSILTDLKNYGFSEKELLEILSFNSSKLFDFENRFGKIEKGFNADFFLTDKKYFDKKSKVKFYFINGEKFDLEREEKK